jgi:capsid protein
MSRRRQIYEGKAKILYEGPEPGTLIQYFKDDATAFNAQKRGTISGKGVLNNRISEHIFTLLGQIGVPTHFIRRLNMREQLIRQVEIIPIEVVVRNVAAGSLSTSARHRGRHPAAAHDHRILLQGRRARRPDDRRRAYRLLRLGEPGGDERHRRHGDPGERLPVRPVRGDRHPPGRLQARVRPALGE